VSTELGSAGVGWLYSPSLLGEVRIRITPASTGSSQCSTGPCAAAASIAQPCPPWQDVQLLVDFVVSPSTCVAAFTVPAVALVFV